MANTNILIKRSGVAGLGKPSSLLAGELAYSYASNTIFIGSPTGNGVVNVGGQYYTSQVDAATPNATALTLVKRDATGNASFNYITANIIGTIQGTANAALQLENSRNFSISGGDITASAVGFNGTADVTLNTSLNAVPGLTAGSVGSSTQIPVITYGANGRILAVTTAGITTSFTVAADSGASQTVSGGDTLTLVGGAGITSTASATDTVTFDVDNTVVRSNTAITTQTIDGSLTINGNLAVLGTQTTINTQTLNIADPMIYLAANNTVGDAVDIGFAGTYEDGTKRHTGVFRNAGNKEYYVFDNYDKNLNANNEINVADASFRTANVNANYFKGNLIANKAVSDGFYGNTGAVLNLYPNQSYAASGDQYIIVDPTAVNHIHLRAGGTIDGSTAELFLGGENTSVQVSDTTKEVYIRANNISAATFANNGTLSVYGKVIAGGINLNDFSQAAFNKANAAVTSTSTLTNGQLIIGAGSNNVTTLANTTYTLTGSLSAAKTITSLTVDAYGRVTAATGADIAIDASQINAGTLPIARGGTNGTSFTDNQITYFDGTKIASLANTTYTQTGTLTANNTLTSITVDGFGRFTAATVGAISGLTVAQGGTGLSTITQNGITYGNGTGVVGVTAAAGTADQTWSNQILTVTNAGVPVWTTALDGGTF